MAFAQGIDVSRYQPAIDWVRVKAAGIAFVVAKASQSNYVDPMFRQHWAGAKAGGLLRGAYHYLVPELEGRVQANAFLKALGADPGELVPVLDVEARTSNPARLAQYALDWLTTVETALGRKPLVYTAAWYWNSVMRIDGQYPAWAPAYGLWVASYPLAAGFPPVADLEAGAYKPLMPKSWSRWTLWQYSSKGRVDGVSQNGQLVNVDLNVYPGTAAEMAAGLGLPAEAAGQPPAGDVHLATNIQMINAFVRAFANQGGALLQSAHLLSSLTARPVDRYAGPEITDLPGLSEAQKTSLAAAVAAVLAER